MTATKIGECDCCEFSPVLLSKYTSQFPREPKESWYCDLCAGTTASRMPTGSDDYGRKEIQRTICHVGNAILAAFAPTTRATPE